MTNEAANLEAHTAVTETTTSGQGPGRRFTATMHPEWEIWGPMGGYVAATALRAAGAASSFARPAAMTCHYLSVARFTDVDLEVTELRAARTALSQQVVMTQEGRPILHALIWSIGEVEGLEHHLPESPDVPRPENLQPAEMNDDEDAPRMPFWDNFDRRWAGEEGTWPPTGPLEPRFRMWTKLLAKSTFSDPWMEAARNVVLLDVASWPSGYRPHAWRRPPFVAPSLDLTVAFHEPAPDEEWLLIDGYAPVAGDGLLGWNARLWSPSMRLVASGNGQALFRRIPGTPEEAG